MEVGFIQVILVFAVTFIFAIDQFDILQSLYQPIVTGPVIGLILGNAPLGLAVGGSFQLLMIGNMPVGGAQPQNAVIGGIMATILAVTLDMDVNEAVVLGIPFAVLGTYVVTLLFTLRAPMMSLADKEAEKANPKGIVRLTYVNMIIIGTLFGLIAVALLLGGRAFGESIINAIPAWVSNGLNAAGGMMRFIGFAILIKVMISRETWGFFFLGFALACIMSNIPALQGPAMLLLAFVGFAFAYWDYQTQTRIKAVAGSAGAHDDGGEEDGI